MKEKANFHSIAGFSLTYANSGEKVKIALFLNCKDDYPEETKLLLTQSTLDDIVYPKVLQIAINGKLPPGFQLRMAHVLMYGEESRNEVLLNEDVRFLAHVSLNEEKQIKPLQQVGIDEINDILGLYPSKKNDPNAAHIMLLKFKGRWHYACNLVYNIESVGKKFENATDFFETAKDCRDKKHWGPLVDNLYSATELAIQSLLLLMHHGRFSVHQDHDSTNELFAGYTTNGNLNHKYAENFSKLKGLRKKGRYSIGVHSGKFVPNEAEIMESFNSTNELINYVELLLHSREISRNPPDGHIIALGQG